MANEKTPAAPQPPPGATSSERPLQRPERQFTILLVVTAITFGFFGSGIGALVLAHLSGVPTELALPLFPSHPYIQIYGFITEFVIGVAYSLLPRFKVGRLPHLSLGYLIYGAITSANILFIASTVSGYGRLLDTTGAVLLLAGSLAFVYQVIVLMSRPMGGFPEANPLIILSAVSLAFVSVLLLLRLEGWSGSGGDVFSPELVFLSLVSFAGSEIYAVQVRSVSFRQCDYRKRLTMVSSALQIAAAALMFVGGALSIGVVSFVGGVLFLASAIGILLSIKILEFAHPLMLKPAMTKMHYAIVHYNEVCIFSGAIWLLFGCVMGVIWLGSGTNAFFVKDSFIHSIAIGFIGSNITCFGPMLLPGLIGKKGPVTGLSLGPIALLNVAVLIRITGDFETLSTSTNPPLWEALSGFFVIASMIWFLVMLKAIGRKPSHTLHAGQGEPDARPEVFTVDSLKNKIDVRLTVTGRKTAAAITFTVWFIVKDGVLYFLPSKGSSTQWYKNVLNDSSVKVLTDGRVLAGTAQPVLDSKDMRDIIRRFKDKYSERNFTNFYAGRVNVAVRVVLRE